MPMHEINMGSKYMVPNTKLSEAVPVSKSTTQIALAAILYKQNKITSTQLLAYLKSPEKSSENGLYVCHVAR